MRVAVLLLVSLCLAGAVAALGQSRDVLEGSSRTSSGVSGNSSSKRLLKLPERDAFLWGLTFDEKGDKPCLLRMHWWSFTAAGGRDDFETEFDICGGEAKGDREVMFRNSSVKLPAIDSIRVCQSSASNPKLKGVEVTAAAIDRGSTGLVEGRLLRRFFLRTNCSSWRQERKCPSGQAAVGVEIHHDGESIIGLELACAEPRFGPGTPNPAPTSAAGLYGLFENDIRVQVDKDGRTEPMSIERALARHEVNGATVVIVRGGKVDRVRHYGVKSRKTNAKVDGSTIFDVASMSKLPAAIAMLAAAREDHGPNLQRTVKASAGQFSNSLLARWVEKQFKKEVESGFPEDITVERLLSSSAGLDTESVGIYITDSFTQLDTILLGGLANPGVKPLAAPGTRWEYSGGGFSVAEAMLEAHTGKKAKEFLDRHVLEALGMRRSTYADASDNMPNLARGCSRGLCNDKPAYTKAKFAGGLLAHPEDYTRLALILLNDGRDPDNSRLQLVPAGDVARILTPISHRDSSRKACAANGECRDNESCFGGKCIRPLNAWGDWYGLGMFLEPGETYNGLPRFIKHGGGHADARSSFEADRKTKDAFLFFIAGKDEWKKDGVRYGGDHLYFDLQSAYARTYK